MSKGFLDRVRGLGGIADIGEKDRDVRARHALENISLRIRQSLLTSVDKHHLAALGTENPSGGRANSRAAARDQSNLADDPVHRGGPFPFDRTGGRKCNPPAQIE